MRAVGGDGGGGGGGGGPGSIVVLNGTPRAGKSCIARAVQASSDSLWLNVGVDAMADMIPDGLRPGIGLRPGGERPDLEDVVVTLFAALYAAVAGWSRAGVNVIVDVGHHDDYSKPLGILTRTAVLLRGLPAYLIGVRCPVEVIAARRDADPGGGAGRGGPYVTRGTRWSDPRRGPPLGARGARPGHVRPRGGHVEGIAGGMRGSDTAASERGSTRGVRDVRGWRSLGLIESGAWLRKD